MNNVFLEYVQALLKLNAGQVTLGTVHSNRLINNFCWGLLEEYEEFWAKYEENDITSDIKEAGDVLAYATLILLCFSNSVETVAANLEKINASVLKTTNYPTFSRLYFTSNLKRFNREDTPIHLHLVEDCLAEVLHIIHLVHKISFKEVATTNISKLTDRKARNVMFKGSGDNR